MIGIRSSLRPHITEMLGVKPSSLTQWESSTAHGHEVMGEDRGLVNATSLAPSAEDALSTVIDDMGSIRDLIVSRQLSSDIRRLEAAERAEAEKLLSQAKEKVVTSDIEIKALRSDSSQGSFMNIEDKALEELGLSDIDFDSVDVVEQIDKVVENLSNYTGEAKFEQLLKANKDQSDFVREIKTTDNRPIIEKSKQVPKQAIKAAYSKNDNAAI